MRKVIGLIVVVALLIGVMTMPAAAVPVTDLTALAQYFPVSAPVYVGFRTDEAYLDELQDVLNVVANALPAEFAAQVPSIRDALDQASAQAPMGNNFDEVFRSWLGERAAFGILNVESLEQEGEYMLVIESTSREEADKFWSEVYSRYHTREVVGDMVVFTPTEIGYGDPYAYLTDDLVVVSSVEVNLMTRETRLNSVAEFNDAFTRLPEDSYNIAMYLDLPALARSAADDIRDATADAAAAMLDDLGVAAVGFTIIDGRSLTIDIATGAPAGTFGAVNPQFADHVRAGTPLVIHGTNLAATYRSAIEAAREAAIASGTPAEEFDRDMAGVTFAVRGATGLDLETEVLAWMTGDYVLALGLSPSAQDASSIFGLMSALPVEFAIVIDASADPASAQALASGLSGTLAQFATSDQLVVSVEEIGGVSTSVLTITTPDLPFPLEIIMGASDEVFFIGTRRMAVTAFTLENGLIADPNFVEGWSYALEDANYLLYASGVPLAPLGTLLGSMAGSGSMQDGPSEGDALRGLLNALTSSTISSRISEDVVLTRMVLTLGE